MKKSVLLAFMIAVGSLLAAPSLALDLGIEFTKKMNEGIAAYNAGDYEAAKQAFDDALLLRPASPEAKMNYGLATAKLAENETAEDAFSEVADMSAEEKARRAMAFYNRGRSRYDVAEGLVQQEKPELERALAAAIESLKAFETAAEIAPELDNAEYNVAQAQHLIEQIARQLFQQQQQQQQQNQQNQQQQSNQDQQQNQQQNQGEQNQQQQEDQEQQQDQSSQDQQQSEQQNQQEQDEQLQDSSEQGEQQDESTGNVDNQREEEPGAEEPETEEKEQSGNPEQQQNEQQQGEQDQRDSAGGSSSAQQMMSEGMTEQQARNLLNLLGTEELLKFRTPRRPTPSGKEW